MKSQIYKGDPRTCAIFIPAWTTKLAIRLFPAIKITLIHQVHMFYGLSVKINTYKTPHGAQRSWTQVFLHLFPRVWSGKTLNPQFEPHG